LGGGGGARAPRARGDAGASPPSRTAAPTNAPPQPPLPAPLSRLLHRSVSMPSLTGAAKAVAAAALARAAVDAGAAAAEAALPRCGGEAARTGPPHADCGGHQALKRALDAPAPPPPPPPTAQELSAGAETRGARGAWARAASAVLTPGAPPLGGGSALRRVGSVYGAVIGADGVFRGPAPPRVERGAAAADATAHALVVEGHVVARM
jgi:hypothetical protein